MGLAYRGVLSLLFLAVGTLAVCLEAQAPATTFTNMQQQQQQVAQGPATTFTNMAQQVAQASAFPNTPGSVKSPPAQASTQLQSAGNSNGASNQAQNSQAQQNDWAPKAAPAAQTWQPTAQNNWQAPSGQAAAQSSNTQQQQQPQQPGNPNMPPQPPQLPANGPQQPNPQGTINTIGSVVQAAGSLASAQQALTSAGSAAGTGDILQTVGQAAQAMQAVQRAAGDVGNAQKSIQTNGAYVASPIPQATPSPPTVNINVPGLGGNGGTQGPPGISYAAPATQGSQAAAQPADPLAAIGSALAQAAFGGGLSQPAAANVASLQDKSAANQHSG